MNEKTNPEDSESCDPLLTIFQNVTDQDRHGYYTSQLGSLVEFLNSNKDISLMKSDNKHKAKHLSQPQGQKGTINAMAVEMKQKFGSISEFSKSTNDSDPRKPQCMHDLNHLIMKSCIFQPTKLENDYSEGITEVVEVYKNHEAFPNSNRATTLEKFVEPSALSLTCNGRQTVGLMVNGNCSGQILTKKDKSNESSVSCCNDLFVSNKVDQQKEDKIMKREFENTSRTNQNLQKVQIQRLIVAKSIAEDLNVSVESILAKLPGTVVAQSRLNATRYHVFQCLNSTNSHYLPTRKEELQIVTSSPDFPNSNEEQKSQTQNNNAFLHTLSNSNETVDSSQKVPSDSAICYPELICGYENDSQYHFRHGSNYKPSKSQRSRRTKNDQKICKVHTSTIRFIHKFPGHHHFETQKGLEFENLNNGSVGIIPSSNPIHTAPLDEATVGQELQACQQIYNNVFQYPQMIQQAGTESIRQTGPYFDNYTLPIVYDINGKAFLNPQTAQQTQIILAQPSHSQKPAGLITIPFRQSFVPHPLQSFMGQPEINQQMIYNLSSNPPSQFLQVPPINSI